MLEPVGGKKKKSPGEGTTLLDAEAVEAAKILCLKHVLWSQPLYQGHNPTSLSCRISGATLMLDVSHCRGIV